MTDQTHYAPGFVPTQFPTPAPVAPGSAALSHGSFDRRPRSTPFRIELPALAVGSGSVALTVAGPSLVELISSNLLGGNPPTNRGYFEFYWMPDGDRSDEQLGSIEPVRMRFVGPYAFLPRAGRYRIVGILSQGTPAVVTVQGALREGVSESEYLGLVNGLGVHDVISYTTPVTTAFAVAVPANSSFGAPWRQRRVRIQNIGAGNLFLRMGGANETIFMVPSAGSSSIDLGPDIVGRGTLSMTAAADTTAAVLISRW